MTNEETINKSRANLSSYCLSFLVTNVDLPWELHPSSPICLICKLASRRKCWSNVRIFYWFAFFSMIPPLYNSSRFFSTCFAPQKNINTWVKFVSVITIGWGEEMTIWKKRLSKRDQYKTIFELWPNMKCARQYPPNCLWSTHQDEYWCQLKSFLLSVHQLISFVQLLLFIQLLHRCSTS